MEKYAILGYPLKHTMSPPIHKRLFELEGKSGTEYEICEFPPETLGEKASYLNSLGGYNITIPFKVDIIKYIDEMDESAKRYESVNCVVRRDGKNIGYNTDCYGFLRSLEAAGADIGGKVLQIGCGGVGRMMAIEAILHGADLTVVVLPGFEDTAQAVIDELRKQGCSESDISRIHVIHNDEISGKFDLLVNATPVGMFPKIDACPVSEEVIKSCDSVFEVIYNPNKTKLMQLAEANGIKTIGGMAMLVWQAVVAHEIWSGAKYNDSDIEQLINDMKAQLN
ncbi:MAG: shikimate dehydrogenase family protein [Huintestinicola sp.]